MQITRQWTSCHLDKSVLEHNLEREYERHGGVMSEGYSFRDVGIVHVVTGKQRTEAEIGLLTSMFRYLAHTLSCYFGLRKNRLRRDMDRIVDINLHTGLHFTDVAERWEWLGIGRLGDWPVVWSLEIVTLEIPTLSPTETPDAMISGTPAQGLTRSDGTPSWNPRNLKYLVRSY
jgi:hypothetical protein